MEEKVSISAADHQRAQVMWQAFNCANLKDYMLRYLELDCRLLADVFEHFRRVIMEEDGLEVAYYMSIPHLTYASAFKFTKKSVGLILDPEIYRDVERCKRGGFCFVNKHWCKAKNPYVFPGTKHSPTDVYLGNMDANNLYGNALRWRMPVRGFRYISQAEIDAIDFANLDIEAQHGYFVVCDLRYPPHIHEKTADLPLAPEVAHIDHDMLSNWSKHANARYNLTNKPSCANPDKFSKSKKLLATCRDKIDYVVHSATLQFYLQMGMEIIQIHRVIEFEQEAIFQEYIDYNSAKRAQATNDFEKDLYKLKNNALYGKSLENKRSHTDIILCNSRQKAVKAFSEHRFRAAKVFSDELVAAQLTKCNIELNTPIAIGATVLEISKLIMYRFVYQQLPKYEEYFGCKIKVVGGDTDSVFLEVIGVDVFTDLYPKMFQDGLLDTSNYPRTNPLFSNNYKAKLNCFKDEFMGEPYWEFILLRPKSYSMISYKQHVEHLENKKKCKGIARRNIKRFTHEDYRKTLFTQTAAVTRCRRMQSHLHVMYTIEQEKVALSFVDDKRFWLSNNNSRPYGFYNNDHLQETEAFSDEVDPAYDWSIKMMMMMIMMIL